MRTAPRRTAALAGVAWLALAAPAQAHGLPNPPGVAVPGYLFAWGAALVLVGSFTALSRMWDAPRLEPLRERPLVGVAPWARALCGAIGIAVFTAVVYAGLAGSSAPTRNLVPTFVYVAFWVALVPISVVAGDVF